MLLLGVTLLVLHELTVHWDLHFSVPRREVGPFEQMVHSFMELLPLAPLLQETYACVKARARIPPNPAPR